MHVGTQQFNTSDKDLEYLARHGVFNKNENFITFHGEYGWDVEELAQKREVCPIWHRHGDGSDTCRRTQRRWWWCSRLHARQYTKGNKEIELFCNMVRQAAEAGIVAVKYYLCEIENQRTESKPPGRRVVSTVLEIWGRLKTTNRDTKHRSRLRELATHYLLSQTSHPSSGRVQS